MTAASHKSIHRPPQALSCAFPPKALAGKSSIALPLPIVIFAKVTMMLLIIATPILPVIAEQDRIGVHVSGCKHQGVRQSTLDGNARTTWCLHTGYIPDVDRRVGAVEDGDVPSIIILGRIGFLVLDHVHRAPAGRVRGLDAGVEDGVGVGLLAAGFGVEDACEFGGDAAAAAGGAVGVLGEA